MNESLLQLVHRSIRGQRAALRSLIDRYQGLSYALAYRHAKNFPRARQVALAAWPRVAEKLPALAEPEGFPTLLAACVEQAFRAAPAAPRAPEEEDSETHSILRTAKVQQRRSLRQALAACPRPESTVFFLRYVEGLSVDEIAELYGTESSAVLESLRGVCVDVAYRAGFAGAPSPPPNSQALAPERREALGFAVLLAEGGAEDPAQRGRIEQLFQTDAACRREDEAVRMVLSLATGTFAAHGLPPDFVRDVLMKVPPAEPARRVSADGDVPRSPAPSVLKAEVPQGTFWVLSLVGGLVGLIVTLLVLDRMERSGWGIVLGMRSGSGPGPISLGMVILALGVGGLAMALARPALSAQGPRMPPSYYICYGLNAGLLAGILCALVTSSRYLASTMSLILEFLLPLWTLGTLAVLGLRMSWAFRDLERRIETRLRRIEDALHTAGDGAPAQPRSGTPPPGQETPPAPAPSQMKNDQ